MEKKTHLKTPNELGVIKTTILLKLSSHQVLWRMLLALRLLSAV